MSFWDPSEQKGSIPALWFSSLYLCFLFTELISCGSGCHCCLKESLPQTSDMRVMFYVFFPIVCRGRCLWCLLFWLPDVKSVPRSLGQAALSKSGLYSQAKAEPVAFTDWPWYLISCHCEGFLPCLHAR